MARLRALSGVAAITLCFSLATGGQAREAKQVTQASATQSWPAFRDGFVERLFQLDPYFAVYQGRHEYDGRLPDWSEAGLKVQAEFLSGAIEKARSFDAASLTSEARLERDYLVAVARGRLFWLTDADQPHRNPSFYIGGGLDPNVYVARPYADPETRMKAFIAFARRVPQAAAQIRANLRMPMPLSFIEFGKAGFQGLADYYVGDARAAFASVRNPALQREFDAAAKAASKAMAGLAQWLEEGRGTATTDFALGEARFARMLDATEMVRVPIAELEAIGRADLRRNQAALHAACDRFAPGRDMAGCMAKLNANKPQGGVVVAARAQLDQLKAFVAASEIVSIPGPEQAQVAESPPYNRQNFAYIDIPGPYERGLPSIYYISPPDPTWSKSVQDGYIPGEKDLLFTSVHEVWPGHFLNFLHSNRSPSSFGKIFVGYAFAEGWAHYAEEMAWDAGLGKGDPETHIGQLSNALLRNCRFLSAIGLHTRGMTQAQSEKMFADECYQDEGNARQQAARGTYDPAYLNYTMGKLMIRKLRDDWVPSHGGRSGWKAFHDQFLSYGGPPIPLVRSRMLPDGDRGSLF